MIGDLMTFAGSASLADPIGSSPLVVAVSWLQGTMLGTVATTVTVVAVAVVGIMMLGGRIHVRRGVTVILGCFILFGAPTIAAGIQYSLNAGPEPVPSSSSSADGSPLANVRKPTTPSAGYDPYAGASLPPR